MDVLTKEQRKKNMQNIHNKDTSIEIALRKALWHKGIRFRVHNNAILGKPDIVIKKYKLLVFCDGDFWHGRNTGRSVETNTRFWEQKISRNRERDFEQTVRLRDEGWTVLRFWGSDIKRNADAVADEVIEAIECAKKKRKNGT